jgi:hypothetical protein
MVNDEMGADACDPLAPTCCHAGFLAFDIDKSDQLGSGEDVMKRVAVFALAGPPLAAATLFLILLPAAGLLEGVPIEISTPVLPLYS